MFRSGADAVHVTDKPFEPEQKVNVKVDWKRRWDHMQQHSGGMAAENVREFIREWCSKCMYCTLMAQYSDLLISGQHLVTAIADEMFGFATTSW